MKLIVRNFGLVLMLTLGVIASAQTFEPGDRVRVGPDGGLNVREAAGMNAAVLETQPPGATGTILSPGITLDGFVWYEIDFDEGPDGFSAAGSNTQQLLFLVSTGGATSEGRTSMSIPGFGIGALEVQAPPGALVYLNDAPPQVVGDDGVLYISQVLPGEHAIRIEYDSYLPDMLTVAVDAGEVVPIRATLRDREISEDILPVGIARLTLESTAATMILQCFPMACSLEILGRSDEVVDFRWERSKRFGDGALRLENLRQGEYEFRVAGTVGSEERFKTTVRGICHGETLVMFVDLHGDPAVVRMQPEDSRYPDCAPLGPDGGSSME